MTSAPTSAIQPGACASFGRGRFANRGDDVSRGATCDAFPRVAERRRPLMGGVLMFLRCSRQLEWMRIREDARLRFHDLKRRAEQMPDQFQCRSLLALVLDVAFAAKIEPDGQ